MTIHSAGEAAGKQALTDPDTGNAQWGNLLEENLATANEITTVGHLGDSDG